MKLIIGASGSGKSRYVYEDCIRASLEDRKGNYIFLVPEQYTLQAQKNIVKLHPDHATANIDVLSFNRLAYLVFSELGIKNPEVLDDIAKAMIIKKIAVENRDKLGIWKKQFAKAGFLDDIKSMLSELYQYGIHPEKIREISEYRDRIPPLLRQKLQDMGMIYKGFADFIKDKYLVAEEIPDVLSRNISKSDIIKKSYFYMDGFTGFTPVQYRIIEGLLRDAKGISLTITIGSGEEEFLPENDIELFYMGKLMYKKLGETAAALEEATEIIDLNKNFRERKRRPRFTESLDLDFLERNFLRYKNEKKQLSDESIQIIKARNIDGEVEVLCKNLLYLVKEENLRFKDIAVIGGDMENYEEKIIHHFERNGIPYFMDSNIGISDNALSELIRAALEVIEEGYSYDSVMRYLRCGLVGEEFKKVSMTDNYMLAYGIKGYKKMKVSWERLPDDMDENDLAYLNVYKDEILEQLSGIHHALHKNSVLAEEVIEAILALFNKLKVEEKLSAIAENFAKEKNVLKEREYAAVYEKITELLEKMRELLTGERLSGKEFLDLVNAGIEQIAVGIIPTKADGVLIGDLIRSRIDEIKALFIIGANEGVIPKLKQSKSIFNDRDKESLKEYGLELSSTTKEDIFMQRFYLYMHLTKPSKYLFISYAGMDGTQKNLRYSSLIPMIRHLFFGLEIKDAETNLSIYTKYMAKRDLIKGFERLRKGAFIIGDESEEDIKFRTLFALAGERGLIKAATYRYTGSRIGREAALNLFGEKLHASVTRLEKYVDCPYAHFLRYGLGLFPRKIHSFEAVDMGNLVHGIIEKVFTRAKGEGKQLALLDTMYRNRLVEKAVREVLSEDGRGIYKDSAKNTYMIERLIRMSKQSMWVLAEQLKKGDFVPSEFEKSFTAYDCPQALSIELGNGKKLLLQGKIDRVDICNMEDTVYVKIIDYKTGSTTWEPDLTYYGKQMQLVLYLDAVMEMSRKNHPEKKIIPAAMFYLNLDDPIIDLDIAGSEDNIGNAIIRALKPSGLVNTDLEVIRHLDREAEGASDVIPVVLKQGMIQDLRSSVASTKRFEKLQMYIREKSTEIGREILSGKVSANPVLRGAYSACSYCEYASICGFDKKTEGYYYRNLKKIKTKEVWEKIDGEELDEGSEECDSAKR